MTTVIAEMGQSFINYSTERYNCSSHTVSESHDGGLRGGLNFSNSVTRATAHLNSTIIYVICLGNVRQSPASLSRAAGRPYIGCINRTNAEVSDLN